MILGVDNEERQFIADCYFRTHNTGVRGTKANGKRPQLAILDDLVSDEDARSKTMIAAIEDTVHKAIDHAMHPTRSKIIWSGTPFNASDPLYKAIESGAWAVNCYPVCEKYLSLGGGDIVASDEFSVLEDEEDFTRDLPLFVFDECSFKPNQFMFYPSCATCG